MIQRLLCISSFLFIFTIIIHTQTLNVPSQYQYIQTAIDSSQSGDTILVQPGTYIENIDFSGKNIVLKSSAGATLTIIKPANNGVPVIWFHNIYTSQAIMDGFTISDGGPITGGSIEFAMSGNPVVKNCIITKSAANSVGAIGYYYSTATLINCLIYKNETHALFFDTNYGQPGQPVFINCTVADNNGYGASCGQTYSPQLINCILSGNSSGNAFGNVKITYSLIEGGFSGVGNINTDPQFVDRANNDYHLSSYSPAIGSGTTNSSTPDYDLEGNPRPNPAGSNLDMGAYENSQSHFKLLSPINSSVVNGSINMPLNEQLSWNKVYAATSYRFQFAIDSTFTNIIVDSSTVSDTSVKLTSLLNYTKYYWRVNASYAYDTSSWSTLYNFTTIIDTPDIVQSISPINKSTDNRIPVQLKWHSSARASIYRLQLSTDSSFVTTLIDSVGLTDTAVSLSNLDNLTTYYWRVNSQNVGGTSAWNDIWNFKTIIAVPNIVQQISPLDNSIGNIQPIKLTWMSSARASSYRLQFSTDSTFTTTILDTLGIVDTSLTVNSLNNLTKYYWRLSAENIEGNSAWSLKWNLTTLGNPTQTALLYPAANSTNIPVTVNFRWNKSQDQLTQANKMIASNIKPKNIINKLANVNLYWFELTTDTTKTNFVVNDSTVTDTAKLISGLHNLTSYWWKVKAMNQAGWGGFTSWSNFTTIIDTPDIPALYYPADIAINQPDTSIFLKWLPSSRAQFYRVQISNDSLFSNSVVNDSTISDSIRINSSSNLPVLQSNTIYFWHVRAENIGGVSQFSSAFRFMTLILPPTNIKAIPGNRKNILSWDSSHSANVLSYNIYRGTTSNALQLIDSTHSLSYIDSGVTNNNTYYYRITSENKLSIEGPFSQEIKVVPFNQPPHAVALNNIYEPKSGKVLTEQFTFSSQGSSDPDGQIDSVFWYINNKYISSQVQFTANIGQGTNKITLVVEDNDGALDSSIAYVNRSMFKTQLNGPIYAGPSLLGNNVLYAIGTGDAVYRIDSTGSILYTLQVGGDVKSSSSIGFDTTVYIASSDKNLYAFSKFGNSLWPALPLGGILTSTPTIDTVADQLYIGVSNKNLIAVNRLTGNVNWSYFANDPIVTSAALTVDRKLIFATVSGSVYGIDLTNLSQPIVPAWQLSLQDSIFSSPAIDGDGNIYYCTSTGKIDKISMQRNQQPQIVWQTNLNSRAVGSPVINGDNTLYIGSFDSLLYAINTQTGNIKWTFRTSAPIESTPAISNIGMVYFGNDAGEVFALDSNSTMQWYYHDSTAVKAPLLYNSGVLYLGTIGERLIAFYDNADSLVTKSSQKNGLQKFEAVKFNPPVWGTFQGNNQRTGMPVINSLTGIVKAQNETPKEFSLSQNYPNPFNPSTIINYSIPKSTLVTLKIYDVLGREISTLVNEEKKSGNYKIEFNASQLASGIYFYRMQAGSFVQTKKLILMK